jgi:hypothetical protein
MNEKFSFKRGWRQVRRKDSKAVQERIMMVLGVHTAMSWSRYLNGRIEPRITEYKSHKCHIRRIWYNGRMGENKGKT